MGGGQGVVLLVAQCLPLVSCGQEYHFPWVSGRSGGYGGNAGQGRVGRAAPESAFCKFSTAFCCASVVSRSSGRYGWEYEAEWGGLGVCGS